ncbi:MAG: UvrD-helicase domain-containing protein [Nitrospirae bacterium]|nr:UvrD-helicase domain-containing protein [Nitrospirota bacterium]
MDLTPQQRMAIEHEGGPLLIIAGAGTGKTLVISHQIAHLILTQKSRPEEILALTFTEKAAHEMEERVDMLVPMGAFGYHISTFHSFGERVLREHGLALGLTTDFRVLSRPEQVIFFLDHLFEFDLDYYRPLSNPTKHIEAILTLISRAKDEDVGPEEYLAHAQKLVRQSRRKPKDTNLAELAQQQMELARTYETYQKLLMKEGRVDFGDLVLRPLNLFRTHPMILKRYQERFRFILVDEFQDTNYTQFQLVRLLARRRKNIVVVGDDDQSIYKFRGAAISNILNFMEYYPKARQVVLTENHRSTQILLDAAYRLIRHNDPDRLEVRNKINKRLKAGRPGDVPVLHLAFDTVSAEADAVARTIEEKTDTGRYLYKDFAILVRANQDAEPFMRALNMRRIPYYFTGNRGLYRREEIRTLTAFMRVLSDPSDSLSLYQLASSEIYRLDMETLIRCAGLADRKNMKLADVFAQFLNDPDLFTATGPALPIITRLLYDIGRFREESRRHAASVLLYRLLQQTGALAELTKTETLEAELKIKNIGEFFEKIRRIEAVLQHEQLPHVIGYLNALIEAGDDPAVAEIETDQDVVHILTVHKAKGLEFRGVFMVSLVEQKFPSRERGDPIDFPETLIKDKLPAGDFHLQEERRLFYVGMTRAKEELYLTSARDYGGGKPRRVSRFVLEALALTEEAIPIRRSAAMEVIRRSAGPSALGGADPNVAPYHPAESPVLSYYKIDDYLTCPLKYKFAHLIRPPVPRPPTVMYGSALHAAAQAYLRQKMAAGRMPLDHVLQVFRNAWVNDGFLSREHEEQRLAAGEETLRRFLEREEASGVVPAAIEKSFKFFIGPGREAVKVTGRWDRIDETGGEVCVIDYKSSNVRTQKKADEETKKSLQLSIYALAYREQHGKIPDRLELHFLESGRIGRTRKTDRDLEKTIALIQKVASGIKAGDFGPRPSYMACRYCAYQEICPYTRFGKDA